MKKETIKTEELMQGARVPFSFVIENAVQMSAKQEKLASVKRIVAMMFGLQLLPTIR